MRAPLLKFVALLPSVIMLLGGAYGTAAFLPAVIRNPDDSLSVVVMASAAAVMLWGIFQSWTTFRVFRLPDEDPAGGE